MAQLNSTIMAGAWLEGTNDFQQRIPNPTQAGIAATAAALAEPMNGDLWNQFSAGLNNTIGYTLIDALRWDNPFDTFRRENLRFGNSIREIMPKWIKAHTYSDSSKNLLDIDKADFAQWVYSVNYETKFPWDLNRAELLRAMSGPDGSTAINDLYTATAIQAINSDAHAMATTCIELFAEADRRWDGGLYRMHVDQGSDRKENAVALLEAIRTMVYRLPWPSRLYNHVQVPVFAKPGELVVFVTPETRAMIDVRAYAELFNVSYAEMQARIMVIPEIPVANALAVITTDNFIHWHDTVYGIFSFFNIDTLNDKQILHHQAVVGANPAVPVVVLTSDAATTVPVIKMDAESLQISAEAETVEQGGTVALHAKLTGSVTANADGVEVRPDSCTYVVTADAPLNSRTFVDKFGVLHCQKTIPVGSTITVEATSTYIYPGGRTEELTATETVTVTAPETGGDFTLTYEWVKDSSKGVPGDVTLPAPVSADSGATVQLAPVPSTKWTTDDGEPGGTAGTWAFAGWSTSNTGAPTVTEVKVTADTAVYGKWTFAAS